MPQRRILIVEESADVHGGLAGALALRGAPVEVAPVGEEALRRLRAGAPPAVIVLDLQMPAVAGEDFLRALRADAAYEDVPVITMSGGREDEGREPLAAARFDVDGLLQIVLSLSATADAV